MTSSATTPSRTPAAATPVAASYAVPRVAPQRRWRPSLLWLAVALIAVGALIAVSVLRTVGTSAEYLAVRTRVEVGTRISRADLTIVRITTDPTLHPVRAAAADTVVGRYAAVTLVAGTLLTRGQTTDTAVPEPGHQLVGLSLTQDRLPTTRVKPGVAVLLVVTADDGPVPTTTQQQAIAPPLSIKATVVDVRDGAKEGTTLLNVSVADRDAPLVAARAAAGRVVVTMTAGA